MQWFNRVEMKAEAKDSFRRQRKTLFFITLVYILLTGIGGGITGRYDLEQNTDVITTVTVALSFLAVLISAALGFLEVGYSKVALKAYDNEPTAINDLFAYIGEFVRLFGLVLVITVRTLLWSLLFIIPGIIAAISYSQSFFIASENPNLSITEVIDESKKLMAGRKWEFFVLQLSFILWFFLVPFTLGLILFWLIPYMQITLAAFYRRLCVSVYGEEAPRAEDQAQIA